MNIQASFSGTDRSVIARFESLGARLVQALQAKMLNLMVRLQSHIVQDKLEGQVLNHRSGKLIGSIRVIEPTLDGSSIVAGVQGGGGPAWYGRVHEYGGVFNYIRRNLHKGIGTPVTVHFPQRSFMRSSFEDLRSTMITELQDTANQVAAE